MYVLRTYNHRGLFKSTCTLVGLWMILRTHIQYFIYMKYVFMYVHMYVCMYVNMYVCMYVCMYV